MILLRLVEITGPFDSAAAPLRVIRLAPKIRMAGGRRPETMSERSESNGGEGGIRTLDDLATIRAFQARALGHYATSPYGILMRK